MKGSGGGANTTATAAVYLTIGAFRNFSMAESAARSHDKTKFFESMGKAWESRDPAGKSVGIVGYGRVGMRVGELLLALGMQIHCFKRDGGSAGSVKDGVVVRRDLDEMLRAMDCVVLCCPYTPETHHILNWNRIQGLKRGVRIVNVARGKCVDEEALVRGLRQGIVGGAGLDVYENDCDFRPDVHPGLTEFDNVTLLPHVGGQSVDSIVNHIKDALRLVDQFFYPM
ncbi:Fc.00g025050.m01.CDS01 [Cosmosporella sp. VM-42]